MGQEKTEFWRTKCYSVVDPHIAHKSQTSHFQEIYISFWLINMQTSLLKCQDVQQIADCRIRLCAQAATTKNWIARRRMYKPGLWFILNSIQHFHEMKPFQSSRELLLCPWVLCGLFFYFYFSAHTRSKQHDPKLDSCSSERCFVSLNWHTEIERFEYVLHFKVSRGHSEWFVNIFMATTVYEQCIDWFLTIIPLSIHSQYILCEETKKENNFRSIAA